MYRYLKDITIDSDGNIVREYALTSYPYDTGADTLFNLMVTWEPIKRISLYARTGYIAPRSLIFPREDPLKDITVPGTWTTDAAAVIRDIGFPGLDLEFSIKNLTDNRYDIPGTYDLIQGDGITAQAMFRLKF
jgi:hypothetical protein